MPRFPATVCAERLTEALALLSVLEGSDTTALVSRLLRAARLLIDAAMAAMEGR